MYYGNIDQSQMTRSRFPRQPGWRRNTARIFRSAPSDIAALGAARLNLKMRLAERLVPQHFCDVDLRPRQEDDLHVAVQGARRTASSTYRPAACRGSRFASDADQSRAGGNGFRQAESGGLCNRRFPYGSYSTRNGKRLALSRGPGPKTRCYRCLMGLLSHQ